MTVNQFNRAVDQLGFMRSQTRTGRAQRASLGIRPVAGAGAGCDATDPDDQDRFDCGGFKGMTRVALALASRQGGGQSPPR
jgi:hypothetical protein